MTRVESIKRYVYAKVDQIDRWKETTGGCDSSHRLTLQKEQKLILTFFSFLLLNMKKSIATEESTISKHNWNSNVSSSRQQQELLRISSKVSTRCEAEQKSVGEVKYTERRILTKSSTLGRRRCNTTIRVRENEKTMSPEEKMTAGEENRLPVLFTKRHDSWKK